MMRKLTGFTLIEMVSILVIVGVIAVVAVARYANLSSSANQNSTSSVAAALGAASAENYAKRSANSTAGSAIANCTAIGALLVNGLPGGYTISSGALSPNTQAVCTVTGGGGTTATFVGIGI
jgi:MSHA pilin protein MshA